MSSTCPYCPPDSSTEAWALSPEGMVSMKKKHDLGLCKPVPRVQSNTTTLPEEQFVELRSMAKYLHCDEGEFISEISRLLAIQSDYLKKEFREKVVKNIGSLRQWINEKPKDVLITNKQLEEWLFPINTGMYPSCTVLNSVPEDLSVANEAA